MQGVTTGSLVMLEVSLVTIVMFYTDLGFQAFIDPFYSSGVHLALVSALSAAATICASIKGDCSESDAANWHTQRFSTSYTRFQVVVLAAYKQIRAQNANILSEIDEDSFDRAFTLLRPSQWLSYIFG
jgi:hypothetical protein